MHQHTNRREYDHAIKTAFAVSQYLPADPAMWVEYAALAGLPFGLMPDGTLGMARLEEESEGVDRQQAYFLWSWLGFTPGGVEAVREYLKKRQSALA
jgi:hypothetical protein